MKKGIYYLPLFLMILFTMIGTYYIGDYLAFGTSTLTMFLLCEVYYLRFLK